MSNWDEDRITEALYEEILVTWSCKYNKVRKEKWKPVHQFPVYPKKSSRGKALSIDFVFSKGYETEIYFAFECKKVDYRNNTLTKYYVEEGMSRYINEAYSAKMSKGGMIGYAFDTQTTLLVKAINTEILRHSSSFANANCLTKSLIAVRGFGDIFVSCHLRNQSRNPIVIYHLFFSF